VIKTFTPFRRTPRFGSPLFDIAVRRHAQPAPFPASLKPITNLETTMTKMMPAAVAFATVLATAASAHAESSRVVVLKAPVSYRAADLATPQGATILLNRVDHLALRMCRGGSSSPLDHPISSQIEACRAKAVARAVAELDAPLVTAAYADRQGATLAAR